MADVKTEVKTLEREYTIPLRREWTKVSSYKRTAKSIKAIKEFIAKHMKVPNRDLDKVKIDSYLNNEIWHRGVSTPPARVTVKAVKKGDIVHVNFVTDPERVKFARERHARKHVKTDKKSTVSESKKESAKLEDKVAPSATSPSQKDLAPEEKKAEVEKEKSVAVVNEQIAEQQAKAQKHVVMDDKSHKKGHVQRRRTIASS